MEGVTRILRRFVSATILISLSLLIFNFILLFVFIFKGFNPDQSAPESVVEQVSQGLEKRDGNFRLNKTGTNLLDQNNAWAMYVKNNGQVQWDYHLPDDIPRTYSLNEIAKLSRYYLEEYPTYVWEHGNGLVVVGYPKKSHWKYQFDSPSNWVQSLPQRLVLLLLFNVGLALLISVLIGTRLIKGVRPLIGGVHNLAKENEVNLKSKGIFQDLARSINSTSSSLKEKNTSLKKRDEARSNWISGISHDIRTPLSMILGYASEMEENPNMPKEQREDAGIIKRQGERLRSLVNDLNLVSMLEYDMQPLHLKSIRLSVLARQVVAEFWNNGLDDRYDIELNLSNEEVKVDGDEKLLLRAISNLIRNSILHNPQGCKIILETSLSKDHSQYRLIVRDDGKGIPQEKLAEITELPYSSKRMRTVKQGHGLGLPMVARITEAHHGRLILRNEENQKGLIVVMEFPMRP